MEDSQKLAPLLEKALASALADCTPATVRWNYENGLLLLAILRASRSRFGGRRDLELRARVDAMIGSEGSIAGYRPGDYNLDQINSGRIVLELWKGTGEARYRKAIEALLGQLAGQPRTPSGSFWHKRIYPNQVWLDGLYMCGPFYAACALEFGRPEYFDDICAQLLKAREVMRDPKTGLYFHAWDESKAMGWADPRTGLSPHIWGRAVGWLSMAIVDILDYLPEGHQDRTALVAMFADLARALVRAQDAGGLWWQVMDRPGEAGNYLETSASSMFAYALLKGARMGYLGEGSKAGEGSGQADFSAASTGRDFAAAARRALAGLKERAVRFDEPGRFHLGGICKVAGLGGEPYRDGSYSYYVGEPIVADDYKGVGPFILALTEALSG
jgi:unsaturated rhamnogalacturonyl hydrolase